MGSSCSSGQGHKDKDSVSTRSEESPSYQVNQPDHSSHTGIILEPATAGAAAARERGTATSSGCSNTTAERKPKEGLTKAFRSVAPSSASADSMSLSSPPPLQSPREFDKLPSETPLPPDLQPLPEWSQEVLLGRPSAARPPRTRKMCLYVCAADSQDCCMEKGALHNAVYPELREYCRGRGYELHIVDLHWKTGLEKQQDHEFPGLCLGELARQTDVAYVIPVLFLSNSLGTPLLPITIENQDFEMALNAADNKQLLHKWYQLDAHAQPPCYRLQPTASHIPGLKSVAAEREKALDEWRGEIARTLDVMVAVFTQELRDTYLTTVVEQEVHNTVFMSQEMARRCHWVCRVFTHGGPHEEAVGAAQQELHRRLENLQRDLQAQLSEKHILRVTVRWAEGVIDPRLPEHAQYLADTTARLSASLRATIDSIIEEDQSKVVLSSSHGLDARLLAELTEQLCYCQRAARCSVTRDSMLQELRAYLCGDSRRPLLLTGPRGCGKTTLMARAAQGVHSWIPDSALILRFANTTPGSRTMEQVTCSMSRQCALVMRGAQCWVRHSTDSYGSVLPRLLAAASPQRPLILLLDGLDQLRSEGFSSLSWLPKELPEHVKLVVALSTCPAELTGLPELQIPTLEQAEAQSMLTAAVMQHGHSVDGRVAQSAQLSLRDCTRPLYVKVLAWQTSCCADALVTRGDTGAQLEQLLVELEETLGAERVGRALALAVASRSGLCDSEMLDLLARDDAFHSRDTHVLWAPSCLFWARLNKQLAPFVSWSTVDGPSTFQWRDGLLLEMVRERYSTRKGWAARALADYYQGECTECNGRRLLQPQKTQHWYNRRKLDELPFQHFQLHGTIKDKFLFDHEWLYDKLCGSHLDEVLQDIALEETAAPGGEPDADLQLLRRCLEGSGAALSYDGRQFYTQMCAQLEAEMGEDDEGASVRFPQMWRLLMVCRAPPVLSLLPLRAPPCEAHDDDEDALQQRCFDVVTRLGESAHYVATVSTEREELAVWDVTSARALRTLSGVTHPINLRAIDGRRCVVLCRRELRIYDLESGEFVTRLKGVMNQKMPYYGLHDSQHLVALSRNRMYVNLMNLDSGDCVTTFKAGEDRFLNSLLVSGDGRVLVCGDETQKPFPLLVWNLASRKLLYDLRIPHHDFVTSLAAITHEGHFVCCVAREVDEPAPNFIVVYDLQSGTLFKKWKPGVSTVSLDISSRDGCVISGLEDSRVLVWDLITGNCRWSLSGHTAPVDFLRLDPQGGSFLSADSRCRDRSLRLWDLARGELLAVYSPPRPITACEVTSGGRWVALALQGVPSLVTMHLVGPGLAPESPPPPYGRSELAGRTFDLSAADR